MTPDVSPTEMRAAELVWERDHGEKRRFDDIPEDLRDGILHEIRERARRIEQFATRDILQSKIRGARWSPQSYMSTAVLAILLVGALALIGFVAAVFLWKH